MELEFTSPSSWWLVVLPLMLIVGALARHYFGGRRILQGRGFAAATLRLLTLGLICASFAGPHLKQISEKASALILVDISESIDTGAGDALLQTAGSLTSYREASIIPFAGQSSRTRVSSSQSLQALRDNNSVLNIGETNLEKGLSRILSDFDLVGSTGTPVLLVTDGFETQGNVLNLLPALQSAQVQIFPLVPERASPGGQYFRISNLSAPLVAPAQKSVPLRVSVQNSTSTPQRGLLKIQHEDRVVLEQTVEVPPNSEEVIEAESDPSQEGIKKIVATLTPERSDSPPSEWRAFLAGERREKVLVIHGEQEDRRFLDEVLTQQSYQVQSIVAGGRLASLPPFSEFSAVVFNNVARSQLPEGTIKTLDAYVQSGGGFLMTGGNRSYGLGGYLETRMEDILPLIMLPPQAEQKRLNVAVQLIIDKSQSMSKDQRLEFAKEAGRQVVENLKDEDYIGVIGFDETPWEVLRTTQVGGNRDFAVERIGRLFPKGQTWLLPALREARRRLEGISAGRKHIIIVTDGELKDAGPVYVEDVRSARLAGITVSTVLIGGEFDFGFLRSLSDVGGGSFYSAHDPSQLPKIFVQDVKVRAGEKTLKENSELQVRPGPGALRSTSLRAYPPLRGFVETRPKSDANYELAVVSGVDGRPLLASWKYEKGRVVAFTSDANGRWSSEWIGWPRFGEFWSNLIDSVRPERGNDSSKAKNIRFDLRRYVERGALSLDLSVFEDLGGAKLGATVTLPDGKVKELSLLPSARGRYAVTLPNAQAGMYKVSLHARGGPGSYSFTPVAFDVSGELFGERKGLGFNASLLEQIARETGGRINPSHEILDRVKGVSSWSLDLTPWTLLAALLFFLLQITLRERPALDFLRKRLKAIRV